MSEQIKVTLNQAETEMLNKLDAATRAIVEKQLLETKAQVMASVTQRRNVFSVKVTEKGQLSVYGLGNRFPVTLRKSGWETILGNSEAIKSAIAPLK